jgi:hypothetical protein
MPVSALQRALLQGLLQSNFSHVIIMSSRKKMSLSSLHRIYNSSAWRRTIFSLSLAMVTLRIIREFTSEGFNIVFASFVLINYKKRNAVGKRRKFPIFVGKR